MPVPTRATPVQPMVTQEVFDRCAVDIMELNKTPRGNKYCIVLTDYLSKWCEAFALPDIKASTVARVLMEQVFCRYGLPGSLHSDRGQPFIGNLMKRICALLGVHKTFTEPFHPQGDGLVERYNRTLAAMIRSYCDVNAHDDWDVMLPYLMFAYRTSVQESADEAPFYLFFGRDPRLPIDMSFGLEALTLPSTPVVKLVDADGNATDPDHWRTYKGEVAERLQRAWEHARFSITKAQARQKKWHDTQALPLFHEYEPEDKVWLAVPFVPRGKKYQDQIKKLAMRWQGPFRVDRRTGESTYTIRERIDNANIIYRRANVLRMRPYVDRMPVDSAEAAAFAAADNYQQELLELQSARVMLRRVYQPHAFGTSRELMRRGLGNNVAEEEDEAGSAVEEDVDDLLEHWEIEKLLDDGENDQKERVVLVKWKNYPAARATWEPLANIQRSARRFVDDYFAHPARLKPKTKRGGRRKPSPSPALSQ